MRTFFASESVGGLTRRELGKRAAAFLAVGAALPAYNEFTLAQDVKAMGDIPTDFIRINANENPMGPSPAAMAAAQKIVPQGGRYNFGLGTAFVQAMAVTEGVPETHIMPYPGSSDPLHRAVLANTSPAKPLVTADPGYEAAATAAEIAGAKVIRVPLRKDYSHDVPEMIKAAATTGVICICNPNNPTGTVTKKEDIEALVAGMPKGCIALIDEAYIHFSQSAAPATGYVAAGKDVIVLRTFSKLYGMAGLRAGAALGRPDLLEKLRGFGGLGMLPVTGMAAATASLKEKTLVAHRNKAMAENREDLIPLKDNKGYSYITSEDNMVMIDSKQPGRVTTTKMLEHKIAIGRTWPSLPNHVRVTIGTKDEMAKFKTALEKVMG